MAAVNRQPWVRNDGGDKKPLRILMPVDAGSSAPIKRGEICKVGENTSGRPAPVDATSDTTNLVIADAEQKSADAARMLPFIVPRPDDIFEFALNSSRAVVVGETYGLHSSDMSFTLAYATSNVVARCASDFNCPEPEEKSVTRRSVSHVQVRFDEQCSYYSELTGNS